MRQQAWQAIRLGQTCQDMTYQDFMNICTIDRLRKKHTRTIEAFSDGELNDSQYSAQIEKIERKVLTVIKCQDSIVTGDGDKLAIGDTLGVVFRHDPCAWTIITYVKYTAKERAEPANYLGKSIVTHNNNDNFDSWWIVDYNA